MWWWWRGRGVGTLCWHKQSFFTKWNIKAYNKFFISGFSLIYNNVKNCSDNIFFFKQLLVQNELIFNLWIRWMRPEFDNTFSHGKGWFTRCWHNIRRDGYLMMMLDYERGRGGQKSEKKWLYNLNYVINYVICKLLSN